MKFCVAMFLVAGAAFAGQSGDRVYTADQTSNTISVIDPNTNKLLGSIHLGEDVPAALLAPLSGRAFGTRARLFARP
jgi:YVTN family beta-propeller protein